MLLGNSVIKATTETSTFNRTTVECKILYSIQQCSSSPTFNRTTVECKRQTKKTINTV